MTRAKLEKGLWGVLVLAVAAGSLACIWWKLDTLPGINGDEAWSATQWRRLASGEARWMTPSGRFASPFYFGAVALAQHWAPGTALALRLPAAWTGTLFTGLALLLLPRLGVAGWGAAILAVAMPLHLAYFRIGWEPAQTPLFALLAVYFSWNRRWGALWLVWLASLVAHLSNLLLFPFLFLPRFLEWRRAEGEHRRALRLNGMDIAGLVAAAILVWTQRSPQMGRMGIAPWTFVTDFTRLITGTALFEYFAAPTPAASAVTAVGLVLLGVALWGLWRGPGTEPRYRDLAWAFVVTLAIDFIVGGRRAVAMETSRAALWWGVPAALVLASGWQAAWPAPRRPWIPAAIAGIFLVAFRLCYFGPLQNSAAPSHATYLPGTEDPKFAAFRWISGNVAPGTEVITEDPWSYHVLEYLNGDPPKFRLSRFELTGVLPPEDGRVVTAFAGGALDRELSRTLDPRKFFRRPWPSLSGKDAYVVWSKLP